MFSILNKFRTRNDNYYCRYKNNVKELAEIIQDEPMTGLEKAIWWTEYVIRHKGAKHLKSPTMDIPFYQYHLLDVIAFLVMIAVISIYLIYRLIKFLLKLISKIFIKRKEKLN